MDGVAQRIESLIDAEVAAALRVGRRADVAGFMAARVPAPRPVTVNFSGGLTGECWTVTRSDGCYSVLYMPRADYFTLCVDSDFGPLDIGVHGPAIDCHAQVT